MQKRGISVCRDMRNHGFEASWIKVGRSLRCIGIFEKLCALESWTALANINALWLLPRLVTRCQDTEKPWHMPWQPPDPSTPPGTWNPMHMPHMPGPVPIPQMPKFGWWPPFMPTVPTMPTMPPMSTTVPPAARVVPPKKQTLQWPPKTREEALWLGEMRQWKGYRLSFPGWNFSDRFSGNVALFPRPSSVFHSLHWKKFNRF